MNVKQLLEKLNTFPDSLEVIISDGHLFNFYKLDNAEFKLFDEFGNGNYQLDIGIGGCRIDLETNEYYID